MRSRVSWLTASLAAAAFLASTRAAAEEKGSKVRYWVDAEPWTCVSFIGPLARQIQLACDASGERCAVATDEASADRRAVLRCGGDRWVLDVGDRALQVELTGPIAERLRAAGVWAARAAGDVRESPDAIVAAPEPEPRIDWLAGSRPAATDAASSAVGERRATNETSGGLAASFRGGYAAYATGTGELVGGTLGAAFDPRGIASWLPRATRIHLALAADTVVEGPHNAWLTFGRAGAGVSIGAPWTDDVFGLAVEGGAVLAHRKSLASDELRAYYGDAFLERYGYPRNATKFGAYGALTGFVQLPVSRRVRPFLDASVSTPDGFSVGPVASLGIGCVWAAW